jgi:hypothetical protein
LNLRNILGAGLPTMCWKLNVVQLQIPRSDAVTVQAYRKIKWGSKRGLLLEAA